MKDKLKRSQNHTLSEMEHIKYRLIMERHEREKEQADNSAMIKYIYRSHFTQTLNISLSLLFTLNYHQGAAEVDHRRTAGEGTFRATS